MTKNKLIELLSNLKGNPEVILWNGFVGDYMHIEKLSEAVLTKQTEEHWIKCVQVEKARDKNDFNFKFSDEEIITLKKDYKNLEWETPDYVSQEDVDQKRYQDKKVVYIEAKTRNLESWDRSGSIRY